MKRPSIRTYVAAVCLLAALILIGMDWSGLHILAGGNYRGFLALVVFGILAEQQALAVKVGRSAGGSSISFLPLVTILLLFGPTVAVASVLLNSTIVEYAIRRKGLLRKSSNAPARLRSPFRFRKYILRSRKASQVGLSALLVVYRS